MGCMFHCEPEALYIGAMHRPDCHVHSINLLRLFYLTTPFRSLFISLVHDVVRFSPDQLVKAENLKCLAVETHGNTSFMIRFFFLRGNFEPLKPIIRSSQIDLCDWLRIPRRRRFQGNVPSSTWNICCGSGNSGSLSAANCDWKSTWTPRRRADGWDS